MEMGLPSPVPDVVAPRDGTPLSLSLPPSHKDSVWSMGWSADGDGAGQGGAVSSRAMSSVIWPLLCFAWSRFPACGGWMRSQVNVYCLTQARSCQEPQCLRPMGAPSLPG